MRLVPLYVGLLVSFAWFPVRSHAIASIAGQVDLVPGSDAGVTEGVQIAEAPPGTRPASAPDDFKSIDTSSSSHPGGQSQLPILLGTDLSIEPAEVFRARLNSSSIAVEVEGDPSAFVIIEPFYNPLPSVVDYALWLEEWIQSDEIRFNEAISGPEADPDRDNLSNVTEYAFGLDPQASDLPPAMQIKATRLPGVGESIDVEYAIATRPRNSGLSLESPSPLRVRGGGNRDMANRRRMTGTDRLIFGEFRVRNHVSFSFV